MDIQGLCLAIVVLQMHVQKLFTTFNNLLLSLYEMRNRSLEVTVQTYLVRVKAIEQENEGVSQCHFTHIARNLLHEMYTPEVHERVKVSLDIYLSLIDEFPAFKQAEICSQTGLFPDASEDYVSYSVQQLR